MPGTIGAIMRSTGGGAEARPALDMLDAFARVGAQRFHLLLTDLAGGKVLDRLMIDQPGDFARLIEERLDVTHAITPDITRS